MNVIVNWSKKPEGATHYCADWHCESTDGIRYYKYANGQWSYWGEGFEANQWVESKSPCKPVTPVPIEKQVAHWTGEGLPPVGSMVIIDRMDLIIWQDAEQFIGPDVKVLANYKAGEEDMIVVESPDERSNCCFRACMARPIRTPEQIARDEKDGFVIELAGELSGHSAHIRTVDLDMAKYLWDQGYRKEVKS